MSRCRIVWYCRAIGPAHGLGLPRQGEVLVILEAIAFESGEMTGTIPYALGQLWRLVRFAIARLTWTSGVMIEMTSLALAPRTIRQHERRRLLGT